MLLGVFCLSCYKDYSKHEAREGGFKYAEQDQKKAVNTGQTTRTPNHLKRCKTHFKAVKKIRAAQLNKTYLKLREWGAVAVLRKPISILCR